MSVDLAFSLPDDARVAWAIVFSEFHGKEFDWRTFTFKEPPQ